MFAFLLSSFPSTPKRTPRAVMILLTSSLSKALCHIAFSTFRILPLKGRIAWKARLRPCLAEPPAEYPNQESSHSSGLGSNSRPVCPAVRHRPSDSFFEQIHVPCVRRYALFAAKITLSTICFASFGSSSRYM